MSRFYECNSIAVESAMGEMTNQSPITEGLAETAKKIYDKICEKIEWLFGKLRELFDRAREIFSKVKDYLANFKDDHSTREIKTLNFDCIKGKSQAFKINSQFNTSLNLITKYNKRNMEGREDLKRDIAENYTTLKGNIECPPIKDIKIKVSEVKEGLNNTSAALTEAEKITKSIEKCYVDTRDRVKRIGFKSEEDSDTFGFNFIKNVLTCCYHYTDYLRGDYSTLYSALTGKSQESQQQMQEAYKPHVNHVFHPEDKEACDEEFAELSLKIKPVGFKITENDYRLPPNTENYYDDSCVGIAIFQKAKSTNEKALEDWLDKLNKKCDFCSFQAYKFDDTKFYITAYFD